jgi:hypothetical protein
LAWLEPGFPQGCQMCLTGAMPLGEADLALTCHAHVCSCSCERQPSLSDKDAS